MLKGNINHILLPLVVIVLFSCRAKDNYPGTEYAPNMYHSPAYDPLKQITDEHAGMWLSNRADGKGEFYNSNPYNPHHINERVPPANTVRRTKNHILPYEVPKDSINYASKYVHNPLDSSKEIVEEGKQLFLVYCQHCHGEEGHGDGLVGQVYKGVPAYNVGVTKTLSEGHIFHVITYGIRRMHSHASQVSIEDRWKIVRYVQVLQNQD